MTDNEIIKALERTASWVCDECKFHGEMCDGNKCEKVIADNALDLINRLKMKNKELDERNVMYRGTIEWQAKEINRQKADIESLKHRKTELQIRNQELQHEKSEAIKEFAERLRNCFCVSKEYLDIVNIIDNLVEEMTEVNENE